MHSIAFLILLIGLLITAFIPLRALFDRTYVPSLVGFMAVGFLLRLVDSRWDALSENGEFAFDQLA